MSVLVYDAVDWQAIPANAAAVAGYVDGPESQWPATAWARFPNAVQIRICTDPSHDADAYDCEPGNGTPEDAGGWALRQNQRGVQRPCIYVPALYSDNQGQWRARAERSVSQAGASGVVWWVASWQTDGVYRPVPGSIGVQYANPATSGGDYDLSIFDNLDWLSGGTDMTSEEHNMLAYVYGALSANDAAKDPAGNPIDDHWAIGYIDATVDKIYAALATHPATVGISPTDLNNIAATVMAALSAKLAQPNPS